MDNYLYKCNYCGKDYKPNRRKKQIYCSSSCRTRAYQLRKKVDQKLQIVKSEEQKKPESISWIGVGNAAAGTLVANAAVSLLTANDNKPATKKDLRILANSLKERYQVIRNLPYRADGAKPFYDAVSQTIVYLKPQLR